LSPSTAESSAWVADDDDDEDDDDDDDDDKAGVRIAGTDSVDTSGSLAGSEVDFRANALPGRTPASTRCSTAETSG
jgi:hypothetical protein